METNKPLPKSIRFDSDTEQEIKELGEIFEESPVKILHRAVHYLYENRIQAVDNEAEKRKSRIR